MDHLKLINLYDYKDINKLKIDDISTTDKIDVNMENVKSLILDADKIFCTDYPKISCLRCT